MGTAELLENFKQLSEGERIAFLDAASRLVPTTEVTVEAAALAERERRMREAAVALKQLYEPGSEHVEWTCLDGEDFLDDYR